jgi:N-acetylglucosaminyl-diphospho-decaprenol L-rhamnosyltransferase
MSLGYLIVTYNGSTTINELLDSIPAKEDILVIDNYSQDDTVALVQKKHVRVIRNKENKGYAAAINQGLELLQEKYDQVFVLNQDIILKNTVETRYIASLLQQDWTIVQPLILLPHGTINVDELVMNVLGYVYPKNFGKTPTNSPLAGGEQIFFSGAAFIINLQKWRTIGLFDESLFLYYEDVDYALRCLLQDERILFEPHIIVEHKYINSLHNQTKRKLLQHNRQVIVRRYFADLWRRLIFIAGVETRHIPSLRVSPEQKKILANKLVPRLVLGFHTTQIPAWQRWAVNVFLVPYAWVVRKIIGGNRRKKDPI